MKDQIKAGIVIPVIVITTVFMLLMSTTIISLALNNLRLGKLETFRLNAQLAADAGLDRAMVEINNDNDYTGTGSEVEILNTGNVRVTYEVAIAATSDDSLKTVTSTGRTYSPASATSPQSERRYQTSIEGLGTDFGDFSLVTGVGGLYMANSSKIVAGDIFVNGEIVMQNSASIGLAAAPVEVKAAHQLCPQPPDANYPRVCNSGEYGQPITISNPAHIYGSVRATNQTSGTHMSNPGLIANQTVAPEDLPEYDRDGLKADIAVNRTGADASCTTNGGTKTWAANTKITGNVTVNRSCTVTVEGDVWITGNVTMGNSGIIKPANSQSDKTVLMIDGSTGLVMRNGSSFGTNSQGKGFQVITYYSTASCSPDCADVTGTNLAASRLHTTIDMDNTAEGPTTAFYARWSRITINNSGALGALIGQTVRLLNSTTITFGTSVQAPGATSPKTWVIRSYKRVD